MLCHWRILHFRSHLRSYAHMLVVHQRHMLLSKQQAVLVFAYVDAHACKERCGFASGCSKWLQAHTNNMTIQHEHAWDSRMCVCAFPISLTSQVRDSIPACENVIGPIWSALLHEHLDRLGLMYTYVKTMVVSVEHCDIIDIDCFGHSSLRLGCDRDTTSSCMSISRRWAVLARICRM